MIDRKKVDLWNSQRIGLVLSGGGAKGAYQAGAFMALYELDIADKVTVVSGTSIGALNTLLFAMQSKYLCKKMWSEISFKDILSPLGKEDRPTLKKIIKAVNSEGSPDIEKLAQLADELVNPESTPFTLEGVRKLFYDNFDVERIRSCKPDLYVCAYNIEDGGAEYFNLKEQDDENLVNAALASAAIPYFFKPITVNGKKYADGGIDIPAYENHSIDNTPTKPLEGYPLDTVIIIHLDHIDTATDYSVFSKEINVIDIYPPRQNSVSSMNFTRPAIDELFKTGYTDAMEALAPFVIEKLKKKPVVRKVSGEKHETE